MKIAIASDDNLTLAQHFGRTKGFAIVTIEENKVTDRIYRKNDFTGHSKGLHNHQQEHAQHSHAGIMRALADCQAVIAGGMGMRLREDFAAAGKQVFVTDLTNLDEIIDLFINQNLKDNPDIQCNHQH